MELKAVRVERGPAVAAVHRAAAITIIYKNAPTGYSICQASLSTGQVLERQTQTLNSACVRKALDSDASFCTNRLLNSAPLEGHGPKHRAMHVMSRHPTCPTSDLPPPPIGASANRRLGPQTLMQLLQVT